MEKQYLKSGQPIPNRGMSFTYYEIEGTDAICRMMTSIPDENSISLYPKPPVKKLFAPDRCEQVSETEFLELWNSAK